MLFNAEPHDVFISYAREDSDWVRQNLYVPLQKCRTAEGRPPRIFFDIGEDGIKIGQDFQTAIDQAIEKARRFIPVYSSSYFQKKMCLQELQLARTRDPNFQLQFLLPILIDQAAVEKVPFGFKLLNFLPADTDNQWFSKLCTALDLQPSGEVLTLRFLEHPGDVFANHTLPVVRIAVQSGGATTGYEEEVSICIEDGQLLGTTAIMTHDGVASFEDLSVADFVGQTRLVARSSTLGEVLSDPFTVYSPAPSSPAGPTVSKSAQTGQVTIPHAGEVVFFATGRHLAVVQPNRLLAYSIEGQAILGDPLPIGSPIHLIRRRGGRLVLADWQGNVHLICDDGRHREWRFGDSASGFVVPADIDIDDEHIYIAFWSGVVFRLHESGSAELVLKDPAGIQALGLYESHLFTCDFAGNLRAYRDGRLVNTATVEPVIWLLVGTPTCLIGVGDQSFYHISSGGRRVIDFVMPLIKVAAAYELSDLPVVIDVDGKAIRFDTSLVINATVYTQPGAEPVSADNVGNYCIFRNPDGTRTLLIRDRIVFSHAQGCLAVSPQGDVFAMGDTSSIQLYSRAALEELIRSKEKRVGHVSPTPGIGADE